MTKVEINLCDAVAQICQTASDKLKNKKI